MNKNSFILLLVVIAGLGGLYIIYQSQQTKKEDSTIASDAATLNMSPSPAVPTIVPASTPKPTPMNITELKIEDLKVGTGEEAKVGNTITVHYTGTLTDGTKFDSSLDRGQPFTFQLGAGNVIQGWEQGFAGMKVGGKRRLLIPASMGYGAQGSPPAIPPNAPLSFEVELLGVK